MPYTTEQLAYMAADRQAATICLRVMRTPDGKAPLITDQAYLACVQRTRDLILSGKTPEEAEAIMRAGGGSAQAGMSPNWLLWGGIAAGVLVVGYLVFFRR